MKCGDCVHFRRGATEPGWCKKFNAEVWGRTDWHCSDFEGQPHPLRGKLQDGHHCYIETLPTKNGIHVNMVVRTPIGPVYGALYIDKQKLDPDDLTKYPWVIMEWIAEQNQSP